MNPEPFKCPHAFYTDGMKINCKRTEGRCAHQRFKPCVGWWVNTDQAADCTMREETKP